LDGATAGAPDLFAAGVSQDDSGKRSEARPWLGREGAEGVVGWINEDEALRPNRLCDRRLILREGGGRRRVVDGEATGETGEKR